MKNILLVLVGGTICTELDNSGMLSVSRRAGVMLRDGFYNSDSFCKDKVNIECTENLLILSENMTVGNWNLIIDTVRKYTAAKKYDGIIFAHGTDTLGFSAPLFSLILTSLQIPVFFVSANERLSSPRSNGNENFRSAIECICLDIAPNVYVVYKNLTDNRMFLHLASRLTQCGNYSEDFYSVGAADITDISAENANRYFDEWNNKYPQQNKGFAVDIFGDWHLCDCVLKIEPYVGINYDIYDYSKFRAVLHGSFHSGTACSMKNRYNDNYGKGSILYMLDKCASYNEVVDTYFSPSKPVEGTYETVGIIAEHRKNQQKINFLYGTTNEMAYAKLLLGYSVFKNKADINELLDNEYNFEKIFN